MVLEEVLVEMLKVLVVFNGGSGGVTCSFWLFFSYSLFN